MLRTYRSSKPLQAWMIVLAYVLLMLASAAWDFLSRGDALASWKQTESLSSPDWLWGGVFLIMYLGIGFLIFQFLPWASPLRHWMSGLLTPLSYLQILGFSLLSGIAEEWFFRGVLLHHFGLYLSSLIFGLAHLILSPGLWVWSLWSGFTGLGYALLLRGTESLALVAGLHSFITCVLLLKLNLSGEGSTS